MRRAIVAVCAAALVVTLAGCPKYGALQQQWSYKTGDTIAATPVIESSSVFIGSWDGYEYSLNESTGALKWRTYLGRVNDPGGCDTVGLTSAPLTIGGNLYLGGGDDYWWALTQSTGQTLWRVQTGSTASGMYNWSTPAELNGFAYVGVASLCDTPLVQGKLYRVNLSTHQIVNTWKVVPDGQVGGTIWTKPVVDAARNTVYVTTGNRAYDSTGNSQVHAEALVALDATTLAIKGYWSLPVADPTPDADWGTAPLLFRDRDGRDLVAAANKNGILYAFSRDNVSAGPVWTRRLAHAAVGNEPAAGGVYSNGFFDGFRVFYASGGTEINGQVTEGSVRALDPRNGAILWEKALPTRTFGALSSANGMLVVPGLYSLYVLDSNNGDILYENKLTLYGAGTIKNGRVVIGDYQGNVRSYTFPPNAGPPPSAAAQVALAQGCQRLRQPGIAGARVRATRLGSAGAPARIAVYRGAGCTGRSLARARLRGGDSAVVKLRKAMRRQLWVRSSRALRLKLTLTR
jgi:outer membrane protein assembly factor BamB